MPLVGAVHRITSRRKAAPISMSAFRGKADVNHYASEGPLLAITGHPAARPKSKIGCSETPSETANSASGILRDRNWREGCTEISLFPYTPLQYLPSLWHACLAQRFDESLNGLHFKETQHLTHKAQRIARLARKKLVECIPGFLLAPEFGERGR